MRKKYELSEEETIRIDGHVLHRIRSLRNFGDVHKGDLGGFIEKQENLSHINGCWAYDDSMIFGNARVSGNATIYDQGKVFENAHVFCYARISDNANVYGNACIFDNAQIYNNAEVCEYGKVFGKSKIFENASIYGNATIKGGKIHGDSIISGNDTIGKGADIAVSRQVFTVCGVYHHDGYITFYLSKNKEIMVSFEYNTYTLKEFEEFINRKFGNDPESLYYRKYMENIQLATNNLSVSIERS